MYRVQHIVPIGSNVDAAKKIVWKKNENNHQQQQTVQLCPTEIHLFYLLLSRFASNSVSVYATLVNAVRNENSMTPLNNDDIEKSQQMLMATRALSGHLPIRPTPLGIAAAAAAAAAFRGNIGALPWPASQMSAYPGMFPGQGFGAGHHGQGTYDLSSQFWPLSMALYRNRTLSCRVKRFARTANSRVHSVA